MPGSTPPGRPGPPRHVAITMDGNARWAAAHGLPRSSGHARGAQTVRDIVYAAAEMGIGYLTLYGFSSENWSRPADEVGHLMGILRRYLTWEVDNWHRRGFRISFIGERERLGADVRERLAEAEARTAGNRNLHVLVALSYGARGELARAARGLAEAVAEGSLAPRDIDEAAVSGMLYTSGIPDPDLMIRTGGEQRISNFLLWQAAYAEFYFTDRLWPDFSREDLAAAVADFAGRERRYGARAA